MGRIMTIGEIVVEIMATERGQSFRVPGNLVGPQLLIEHREQSMSVH
jgi:hypothetical protein